MNSSIGDVKSQNDNMYRSTVLQQNAANFRCFDSIYLKFQRVTVIKTKQRATIINHRRAIVPKDTRSMLHNIKRDAIGACSKLNESLEFAPL